jgi:signal transduction histidine kinase
MPDDHAPGERPAQQSATDVAESDREKAERERLASMCKLARGVAHDFNNFLMVILGQAEIGLLTAAADSPGRAQFEQIRTASLRAADLCRQLMAYAGQSRLSLATIDLAALLAEVVAEIQPSLNPSCELRSVWTAEQIPPVEADKAQLRAVIISAIRNAAEALPPAGGVIALIARKVDADQTYLDQLRPAGQSQPGQYVGVEVVDNGNGMTEETLASAFDPFFSTKKARPGMGLPTLLGVIRSHGGAVHLESAVGRGTTLRMLLPAARDSQEMNARLRELLGQ